MNVLPLTLPFSHCRTLCHARIICYTACSKNVLTASAFHKFYYGRHSSGQGPITLLENGMFVGGSYKPNGHWKVTDDMEQLILLWHSWPKETLRRTPSGGYSNEDLVLDKVSSDSNCNESHRWLQDIIPDRGIYGYTLSGMCDRITNILLFHSLANEFGRSLYWGWPLNSACNCSFHKLFECNAVKVVDSIIPLGSQLTVRNHSGTINDLRNLMRTHNKKPWIFTEHGYYGHNFDQLDTILRPERVVSSLIENFKQMHWRSRMIGIHVRRADKAPIAPHICEYFAVVDSVINMASDVGLFLCSDDLECGTLFSRRYGERVVTYPVRTLRRDLEAGIVDALICLYLLRNTSGVIGSSMSGYSLCAGWKCGFMDVPSPSSKIRSWNADALRMPEIKVQPKKPF